MGAAVQLAPADVSFNKSGGRRETGEGVATAVQNLARPPTSQLKSRHSKVTFKIYFNPPIIKHAAFKSRRGMEQHIFLDYLFGVCSLF